MEIKETISKIKKLRQKRKFFDTVINMDFSTLYPNTIKVIDYPDIIGENYNSEIQDKFNQMLNGLLKQRKDYRSSRS